jgi:hypothetical protein
MRVTMDDPVAVADEEVDIDCNRRYETIVCKRRRETMEQSKVMRSVKDGRRWWKTRRKSLSS